MLRNKLPKTLRICGKKRIDRLFESGTSGFCHPFRYVFLVYDPAELAANADACDVVMPEVASASTASTEGLTPGENTSTEQSLLLAEEYAFLEEGRVAALVSVPKRNHKRAVRRNLLKRRTREAFRTRKHAISEAAASKGLSVDIALLYAAKEPHDFNTIDNAVAKILEDISQRL